MASAWPKTGEEVKAAGYRSSEWGVCKGCGARILWTITPNNKMTPLSRMEDGRWQPHWADCPARDQFKRKG